MTQLARAIRLLLGAALAWWVAGAIIASELPLACTVAAGVVFIATLVRPEIGLLLVAGLAPAGTLLAAAPARAAEVLVWAMLSAWLLRLAEPPLPRGGSRAITRVAALYGAVLVASWLMLTIGGAAGVAPGMLPRFLLGSIPPDHFVLSSPEPETWTLLQSLAGIAMLVAAAAIAESRPWIARLLGPTLVASLAALAVATLVEVAREWARVEYQGWFLARYLHGERFSVHLADLNAAGSLYVLAGMVAAAMATLTSGSRARWYAPLVVMAPALWLTGSRSAYMAAASGLLVLAMIQRRWPLTPRQRTVSAVAMSIVVLVGAATMDWQTDVRGSAGRAASLRSQFLETSARMFSSAPVFGVGLGRYFDRSSEFMPPTLRELYGNENAHNYFAQQFAELGTVGGLMFLGLIATIVWTGWTVVRGPTADPALLGVFTGVVSYLVTCVTGHPLLVPQAAIPFWIACGVLAGSRPGQSAPRYLRQIITPIVCAVLAIGITRTVISYQRVTETPSEQGFHGRETAPDGRMFRWMTRHAVTYVPNGAGFVRLYVHAPDIGMQRPLILETAIAGRVSDVREIPPDAWITYDIPAAQPARGTFQRVDFRANQVWTQTVALGRRQAQRPIAVMLGDIQWIPLEEAGRR